MTVKTSKKKAAEPEVEHEEGEEEDKEVDPYLIYLDSEEEWMKAQPDAPFFFYGGWQNFPPFTWLYSSLALDQDFKDFDEACIQFFFKNFGRPTRQKMQLT